MLTLELKKMILKNVSKIALLVNYQKHVQIKQWKVIPKYPGYKPSEIREAGEFRGGLFSRV